MAALYSESTSAKERLKQMMISPQFRNLTDRITSPLKPDWKRDRDDAAY